MAANMPQDPDNWNTQAFRSKGLETVESAFQKNNITAMKLGKSPADLEGIAFQKAKSKEDYIQILGRVILQVAEIAKRTQGGAGQMGRNPAGMGRNPAGMGRNPAGMGRNPAVMGQNPAGMGQDPINALTKLTRQPDMNTGQPRQIMMQQGYGAISSARSRMIPPNATAQQAGMPMAMTMQGGGMQGGGMQPSMMPQGAMQQGGMQNMNMSQGGMPVPGMQQASMQQHPDHYAMVPDNMRQNMAQQSQYTGGGMMMSHQAQPNYGMTQSGYSTSGGSMINLGPQASPANAGPGMSPHLQGLQPSPMMPGPGPSPQGAIGMSPNMGVAPSPGQHLTIQGTYSHEDRLYSEKLRQLQQYVEPLRRMAARVHNIPERQNDKRKIETLLNFLTNPVARMPMDKLIKCEAVLESIKPEFDKVLSHTHMPVSHPAPVPRPGQLPLGQGLFDAVTGLSAQPSVMDHVMSQAFGPAVQALHGTRSSPSMINMVVDDTESEEGYITDIVQSEVVHLPPRFKLRLDPSYPQTSTNAHLICHLEDVNLPTVPPLYIEVPKDYPNVSPGLYPSELYQTSSPFLEKVLHHLQADLLEIPKRYSITEALNIWELSIRRAVHWSSLGNQPEALAASAWY